MKKWFAFMIFVLATRSLQAQNHDDDFEIFKRSIEKEFADFKHNNDTSFENFRKQIIEDFVEFVKQPWKEFECKPKIDVPKENKVPPVIMPIEEKRDSLPTIKIKPINVVVAPLPIEIEQPQPVVPIKEDTDKTEYFDFVLYGTPFRVRLSESNRFKLNSTDEVSVGNAYQRLSSRKYDNLIVDCLSFRKQRNLCDWAYYQVIAKLANDFCGEDTNEATLLTAFVLQQSGYKLRIGRNEKNKLVLLLHFRNSIYGYPYIALPDGDYYAMNISNSRIQICNVPYPEEKSFNLAISQSQILDIEKSENKVTKSEFNNGLHTSYHVNTNLMAFYETYPMSITDGNKMTRWAIYANTPMDAYLSKQIYPQLRVQLNSLSTLSKVRKLLDFCQTAFVYEYDDKVWGRDRAFFSEETMYYPYADCEDRGILFTRLVRDLVGLDCILIYYPGHIAAGVCFGEYQIPGDYFEINGKKYTVCDPTYIHADVGMSMPNVRDLEADVIILP